MSDRLGFKSQLRQGPAMGPWDPEPQAAVRTGSYCLAHPACVPGLLPPDADPETGLAGRQFTWERWPPR